MNSQSLFYKIIEKLRKINNYFTDKLLTKLHIPQASNNIVHRNDLYEKLNLGLSRKLILISALAGFGKTTLLNDWISQQKILTEWLSVDKGDNDPTEFLSYIISGIQGISKEFGQSSLKLLNSPNIIKTHLKNIYLKHEVDNRAKAVVRAIELGVL